MTEQVSCPLCGGEAQIRCASLPGYIADTSFRAYACARCRASFVEGRQVQASLYDRIYENPDRIPGYHRYERYARDTAAATDPLAGLSRAEDVYWAVEQALAPFQPGRHRVLEVGSGLGYLTHALARRGYDAVGLDVSEEAVRSARARYGDLFVNADLAEFAVERTGAFDAVVICEVIEHLADPVGFVAHAFSLLAPGGRLIITTPNRDLYADDVLWDTEPPPVHFWWFSERSLEVLGERVGGRTHFVDFTPYQAAHPLVLADVPANVPTRRAIFAPDLSLTEWAVRSRKRSRVGDALPWLRSAWMQRLRGKRRHTGPRRTVLCAVIERPAAEAR